MPNKFREWIVDKQNTFALKWMNKIFQDESVLVTYLGGDYGYANIENASAMLNWLTLNHIVMKSLCNKADHY